MYNGVATYLIRKIKRPNWKVHHFIDRLKKIYVFNNNKLHCFNPDTIYNKSNMVVKNSSAQPEDWFGNSNRNHKSIKQKGNPQLEDEQVKSRIWMIIVGLKDTITLLPRL